MNEMQKRKKEFDEMFHNYRIREEIREKRLSDVINSTSGKQKIFLYEAGPLDHWEGWGILSCFPYQCYQSEMQCGISYGERKAADKIYEMEQLLINGLIHFSEYFKNDLRGEQLHFLEMSIKTDRFDEPSSFSAISVKCDNNGTCFCFGYSPKLADGLPHDFGDTWKLIDGSDVK